MPTWANTVCPRLSIDLPPGPIPISERRIGWYSLSVLKRMGCGEEISRAALAIPAAPQRGKDPQSPSRLDGPVTRGLVLERNLCRAGCRPRSAGQPGRLCRAFCMRLALHQACAGFPPNIPSPKGGDDSGANGAFRGWRRAPAHWLHRAHLAGLPPFRCTQLPGTGGRGELSVCIFYTVTFWGGK